MRILAVYDSAAKVTTASAVIRREALGDVVVYSPTARPALVFSHWSPVSAVRVFTLVGGLIGCAIGVGLSVYTMLAWPSVVGGRLGVSIPPIVVITFEMSMLFGALGGFLGFLVLGKLPRFRVSDGFDERFMDDRFGLVVTCDDEYADTVSTNLRLAGAEEVRRGA